MRHRSLLFYVVVLTGCAVLAGLLGWGLATITGDDMSLGITAVATAGLFGATVLLAWRVPQSADSLGHQLSKATAQLANVQAHRDALLEVLSREPLYGEAIPQGQGGTFQASEPLMAGMVAPVLIVEMPIGRLPQRIRLPKEECKEWLVKIERARKAGGGIAALDFSNRSLLLVVPEHESHGVGFSLCPKPSVTPGSPILEECMGFVERFSIAHNQVTAVAEHDLPSYREFKQQIDESNTPD